MRMRAFAVLGLMGALAGCNRTEELSVAETFFARVDSAHLDSAWAMLVDEDRAAVTAAQFAAMYTDTTRVRTYDTVLGMQEISRDPAGTKVKQMRKVPNWDLVYSLRMRGRPIAELAASLHERGNLKMVKDSARVVTVVGQGKSARISLGLAKQAKYHHVLDSLRAAQISLVKGKILSAATQSNLTAFCVGRASLESGADVELGSIVFEVTYQGKPFGLYTVEKPLLAKGKWSGEIGVYYAEGVGPGSFGKPEAVLSPQGFEMKAVSAILLDPSELRLQAQRLSGVEPLELL